MKNKKVFWITMTAVFIALLVVAQITTKPLGQFVTGSLVNLILIVSVMTAGLSSGITVAIVSQLFAQLLGIGPIPPLLPFIVLGNIVLVLLWHAIGKQKFANKFVVRIVALAVAAVCKFGVLYLGIVKLAVPILFHIPEPQAGVMSTMFSFPQLITAAIGGVLAVIILPLLGKALNREL